MGYKGKVINGSDQESFMSNLEEVIEHFGGPQDDYGAESGLGERISISWLNTIHRRMNSVYNNYVSPYDLESYYCPDELPSNLIYPQVVDGDSLDNYLNLMNTWLQLCYDDDDPCSCEGPCDNGEDPDPYPCGCDGSCEFGCDSNDCPCDGATCEGFDCDCPCDGTYDNSACEGDMGCLSDSYTPCADCPCEGDY